MLQNPCKTLGYKKNMVHKIPPGGGGKPYPASGLWPLTKTNLQPLQRNDRAMIRQICSIKPEDVARVRSSELLVKLQLEDLDLILRERRLRWFGHVTCSSGAIRTAYDMQIDGKRGAGRPKQTWKKLTEKDCHEWKLTTVDPQERSTWRSQGFPFKKIFRGHCDPQVVDFGGHFQFERVTY